MADYRGTSPREGSEIGGFMVRRVRLPAAMQAPDPLARQDAGRGLMGTPFGPLLGIVGPRPERMADGCAGPFHEGLSKQLRALEAPVDPARTPTTFGDGGKARILLELRGVGIALALFAKGDEEPRGEDGTGAWEGVKAREVGMGWRELRHGAVKRPDRLQGGAELGHESPDEAHLGGDDALVHRARDGRFDHPEALRDEARLHMALAKEALESGTAGQVDGFEGRPWGEKVAADGRVFVRAP
jgi:hypothetical protein